MADPNIPVDADDIRYEDRQGNFVLVDPTRPEGRRDVATTWQEAGGRWRWKLNDRTADGTPYASADHRDGALEAMLAAYATDPEIATRLAAQRPRFSFGQPQIFRA